MSDSTSWQPPAGPAASDDPATPFTPPVPPAAPPTPPTPPGGMPPPPPPPGFGPPPTGYAPPASGQPSSGWTPPPKPGLIPLRPLTLGTLLGAAFQVLRRNPRPTFGLSLLITGGIYLLAVLVVGVVTFLAVSRTLNASQADADELAAGTVAMIVLSALIPLALSIVGIAILQGVIALEVARGTLGEKLRLGGLWRAARGRIGALIGWSMLIAGVVTVAIAAVAIIIALIIGFGGTAGLVAGVLLGIVAFFGAVALAFWLTTKLALVPSVLMLERLTLRAAIARSWSLTTGYFWKTLGIQLLVAVIVQTVGTVLAIPLQLVLSFSGFLINPNGGQEGLIAVMVVVYVLTIVLTVMFGAITAVVQSAVPALIYIDIRMRKEGLDLELSRFVEARQAGDASVADPYLVKAGTAQQTTTTGSPWS